MKRFLKWLGVVLLLVIGGLWLVGPREPVDTVISFDPSVIGDDIDAYFAAREAKFEGITPGTENKVIWAGAPNTRTEKVILVLHGFSGTSQESRPVPDNVAAALGANMVLGRLTGHGLDGDALAAATAGDWFEDLAELMEVARRVGDEVYVVSVSTGGTLAAIAATDPDLGRDLAGIVFMSPNFKVANPAAFLLTWPAARFWVPLLVGPHREFPTQNEGHAKYWTSSYPTVAALPMAALVEYADKQEFGVSNIPALFVFSEDDSVVSPQKTKEVAAEWGGPVTLAPQVLPPGNDPYNHNIAGDVLSPGMNEQVTEVILTWFEGL